MRNLRRNYPGQVTTYLHQHRAIRKTESSARVLPMLGIGILVSIAWIVMLPFTGSAWVWILDVVREPLGMAQSTTALHYVVGDRLAVVLPRLELPSFEPSTAHLWANGMVCVLLVVVSFLLPVRMAPTNYFLRALALIQGSAIAFFAIQPWAYPYTAGDYLTGLTGAGMGLIGLVPLVLALTHWLLDFSVSQKIGVTVACMGYLFLMIPLKYAVHGVVLYWGGLLYMPVLFILFGLPVEVFAFIAIFSWGMSWERPRERQDRNLSAMPASVIILAMLLTGATPIGAEPDHSNNLLMARADLDMTLASSVTTSTPKVGTSITFTVVATEDGVGEAVDLKVDATLLAGLTFVSYTATQGTYDDGTGEWSVGTLSASGSVTLTLTVTVDMFDPGTQTFEIKSHTGTDIDSSPDNGSTTEDDDDQVALTPAVIGGEVCYIVANSGDTLLRVTRNGNGEDAVGATGTSAMETSAYWPGSDILYATDAGTFGTLSKSTGSFTSIGSVGTADGSAGSIVLNDVDGLAFDPLTGVLWATHRRAGDPNPDDLLFQIHISTGAYIPDAFGAGVDYVVVAATAVTGLENIDDLAIDAYDGTIYAINNDSGADWLVTIDKTDGSVTAIGSLGQDDMEGLTFDAYGNLYGTTGQDAGSDGNSFFAIDKSTGAATLVRTLSTGADHEAVSCLVDGVNNITGNVFLDANANGTWEPGTDSGETGVSVELYRDVNSDGLVDGGDILLAMQVTDGSGDYDFTVASEGDFVLQIDTGDLPALGALTTDNVEVASFSDFGITDSGNRFGYKLPIDLSLTVVVDEPAPDVADNVVFTVTLANDGPSDATGVAVTNTLPGTLTFVSATPSQGSFDSGTGVWTVGAISVAGGATLTITAAVDTEDPGTDSAEVTAADQTDTDSTPDNDTPSEDDQDDATVTPVGGSGGGGGGLESDGSLAGTLARVLFTRRVEASETDGVSGLPRFQFDQGGIAGKASSASDVLRLIVPTEGPDDSMPFESSPRDLLPVTNATDIVAADFLRGRDGRRIGALFATLTLSGELYEHTKVVCDRLRGAELISVRRIQAAGKPFLLSRLIHENGAVDHAVSYVAYRSGDGYVVDSRFRLDEHAIPVDGEDVINVQIWSVSREHTITLLEASLAKLETQGPILFLNDETNPPRAPLVYVRTGHYANGNLHLTLHNPGGVTSIELTGGTLQRTELGDRMTFQERVSVPEPDENGLSHVTIPVGSVFDASFFVETDQGDKDVVYLADGAWSYTYDGDGADVGEFDVAIQEGAAKSGMHNVERAVRMEGEVKTWAVLFRYLRANGRPLDLSAYQYVEFTASGKGQVRVLFEKESIHTSDHHGTTIRLESEPRTHRLWFDQLRRPDGTGRLDASDLLLISFYVIGEQGRSTPFQLKVGDLRFGGGEGDPLAETPDEYELKQNYPNPFNPRTHIVFGLPDDGQVRLEIYDALGRSVGRLVDGFMPSGRHEIPFDATRLASGVYLYRLEAGGRTMVRHMTLLR
ncbi:MAG: putative repeat protein (TIGR01451 family) [Thalassolituus oleivorans]